MATEQPRQIEAPKTDPEQAVAKLPATLSNYSKRVVLKAVLGRSDGGVGLVGERLVIGGWVKSSRELKKDPVPAPNGVPVAQGTKDITCVEVLQSRIPFFRSIIKVFGGGDYRLREKLESIIPKPPTPSIATLQISDGSCTSSLQVLVESVIALPSHLMPTGTCILAEGILQLPVVQGKHAVELKAERLLHVGTVDQNTYPLSRKRLPLESLRDCSHLRPRTTTVASVVRIRNSLTQATHAFFQNHGFLHVEMPIITSTDFEGLGEKFQVTTLLGKGKKMKESKARDDTSGVSLEAIKATIEEKSRRIEELGRTDSNKEALAAAIQDLKKTNELVSQLESREKTKSGALEADNINFSEDFFSCKTYLTASGRLHLESYASALGNVYSFGPRFKAGMTASKKALAETWMVELEMAFSQLEDAMHCATSLFKFLCSWVLKNCLEDLAFVTKRVDKTIFDRLDSVVSVPFEMLSYTEAVEVLKKITEKTFESKVELGISLTEEHESYLADEIYKKPVIICNYPKDLKPFNVRLNDDRKTVAAFDLIVPKAGALIRGIQNEERFDVLNARIRELGLAKEQYGWYLDLRRHGTVKHSGFSFAFDLMVLYATGLNDVKEVIPFPRSYGKASS